MLPPPVHRAVARARGGAWACAQSGFAAAVAWSISEHVLGHRLPFFAAVAAVVALGLRSGQRLHRTAELAVGVALGVLVGDLLVGVIGSGDWQIGVVIAVALLVAVLLGGGGLAVTQAGLQAVFIVALPRSPHSGLHRWQDALVGGGVALLVAALAPNDPWREAGRRRSDSLAGLATVLRLAAHGIRAHEPDEVEEALERARTLEAGLAAWGEELVAGREAARLALLRDGSAGHAADGRRLLEGTTRALRNTRVLLRRAASALHDEQPLPASLPLLLDELATAVQDGAGGRERTVDALLRLAGRLDPVALGAASLAGQVVVGQLRFVTVDLLTGLGVEHDRARNALPSLPG